MVGLGMIHDEKSKIETLWSVTSGGEYEEVQADLDKINDNSFQLSLEGVGMSGYPTIDLTREHLRELFYILEKEFKRFENETNP